MLTARLGTVALAGALTLAAAAGTMGCKKFPEGKLEEDSGASTGKGSTTAATSRPEDDADEQMQDKLAAYIACLNTLSSPVHATRSRYFQWVNPKTGPTGSEHNVLGLYALPNEAARKCTAGLAKAQSLPPRDPKLEAAGDEFAKTVTDLDTLIAEIFTYYESRSFKDDKFAKGKAMHPRLMSAFAAFSKADKSIHATLDAITKPLAQRALSRIEREEGKKFRYHRKHVLLTARELIEAGDPVGDDDDVDVSLYSASFAELDKAMSDLQLYATGHKTELDEKTNPAWPLAKSNYDQFDRTADAYRKKAREYLRCLQDAPAKAKGATGKVDLEKMGPCPEGKPRDVLATYNELITTSNAHQFP